MAKKYQYGPYTARPGKSGAPWLLYLVIAAGLLAAAAGLWYVIAPESLARLHGRFFGPELQISGLTLDVERRAVEIAPGGSVEIHPRQNFSLKGLNSNRWHNYDLRLYSPDFDIARVSGGASAAPLDLLGEEAALASARLRLEVRENEAVRAVFEIIPRYTAVDLAAMGDAAAEPARKADLYQRALALDPPSRPLREKLVNALVGAGREAEAAEMLEEDLERDGPGQPALSRLLALYAEIGDKEKSVATLTRLINLARREGRDHAPYQEQLIPFYIQMKRLDSAAALYEEMAAEAVDDGARAAVLEKLAAFHHDFGRPHQEIEVLKRLAAITPENLEAGRIWARIIDIHRPLGDLEGQQEAWLALAGLLPDGPDKANAFKRAASLLARDQKYAEADRAYQAALALDPGDVNLYLNLGRLALARGDRPGYRSYLEKALELSPERDDLRRELAGAFYDDGLSAEAEAEYETVLAENPDDQDSRSRLIAILEAGGGREERLREEYAKIVGAQADNKVAAYNLAVLDFRGERWDEAISGLKKVLALDPDDLDARGYLFSAYEKKGDRENMLDEALEIYRRDPGRDDYRELLINSYENAADWPRLLAVAEEIVRLKPGDASGWQLLSRVQARLARPLDAAGSLYKAAEAAGDNQDYWLAAAEAMSVQNQLSQAKAAYQKILELDPENKRAAEGLLDISLREVI